MVGDMTLTRKERKDIALILHVGYLTSIQYSQLAFAQLVIKKKKVL